jgi:hypothetical protein
MKGAIKTTCTRSQSVMFSITQAGSSLRSCLLVDLHHLFSALLTAPQLIMAPTLRSSKRKHSLDEGSDAERIAKTRKRGTSTPAVDKVKSGNVSQKNKSSLSTQKPNNGVTPPAAQLISPASTLSESRSGDVDGGRCDSEDDEEDYGQDYMHDPILLSGDIL